VDYLVGYTGFVGSNLSAQHDFDGQFNSKNYQDAFGKKPDTLIYAGVPAQKFIANQFPKKDMAVIEGAIENIKAIAPKTLVLISTIDVYKDPNGADEDAQMDTEDLHAYGLNRYRLEQWVFENRDLFEKVLVVRLPGLYGENLKKNFIYDLINVIPSMLNQAKYDELSAKSKLIAKHYVIQDNGFYKCMTEEKAIKDALKAQFVSLGFTALLFTDSRARFSFYNLGRLYADIQTALKNDIEILNVATQPVKTHEIYSLMHDDAFVNEINRPVPNYDFRTKHATIFGGKDGYMIKKQDVLDDIKAYLERNK
jgi:hypothetical protein